MEKFWGKLLKKGRRKIFSEIWPPVSEVLDPLVVPGTWTSDPEGPITQFSLSSRDGNITEFQ